MDIARAEGSPSDAVASFLGAKARRRVNDERASRGFRRPSPSSISPWRAVPPYRRAATAAPTIPATAAEAAESEPAPLLASSFDEDEPDEPVLLGPLAVIEEVMPPPAAEVLLSSLSLSFSLSLSSPPEDEVGCLLCQ